MDKRGKIKSYSQIENCFLWAYNKDVDSIINKAAKTLILCSVGVFVCKTMTQEEFEKDYKINTDNLYYASKPWIDNINDIMQEILVEDRREDLDA